MQSDGADKYPGTAQSTGSVLADVRSNHRAVARQPAVGQQQSHTAQRDACCHHKTRGPPTQALCVCCAERRHDQRKSDCGQHHAGAKAQQRVTRALRDALRQQQGQRASAVAAAASNPPRSASSMAGLVLTSILNRSCNNNHAPQVTMKKPKPRPQQRRRRGSQCTLREPPDGHRPTCRRRWLHRGRHGRAGTTFDAGQRVLVGL